MPLCFKLSTNDDSRMMILSIYKSGQNVNLFNNKVNISELLFTDCFPRVNDVLLNNLLYVIDDPDEIIKVASRLLDITHSDDIKYDALLILASAYSDKGDTESVTAVLEKIPEIYFSKLECVTYLLKGDVKRGAADKQKWLSFESLIKMMWTLADCFEENDDLPAALAELKRVCN